MAAHQLILFPPSGLCECGCGQPTRVAPETSTRDGWVKGQPVRFVSGHNFRRGWWISPYRAQTRGKRLHVAIAERAPGHPLPRGAVVHHVDENKQNNANANLVICQDHAYHMLLHARMRVVKAGGNPNTERWCAGCRAPRLYEAFWMRKGRWAGKYCPSCRVCDAATYRRRKARRRNRIVP